MKKLLYISDYEKFWAVFNRERAKEKARHARMPFAKKIEIILRMQKLFPKIKSPS